VVKMLYVFSILSLICAGLLLGLCSAQWLQGVPPNERDLGQPISERLRAVQSANGTNAGSSPLLEQAQALALYLDPPKPLRKENPQPISSPLAGSAPPVVRPPTATPQFRLLAISYYRASPEKSLAMVWDATKGGYWVRKGDRLGHFVVERIEKEAVFYRDGDQLRQMAVAIKQPVQLAKPKSRESASIQKVAVHETVVSASP